MLLVIVAVVVLCGAIVAGAGAAYDHGHRDRIANGIHVGDIDVGGLDAKSATERVRRLAVTARQRDLRVHAKGRTFVLAASKLRAGADVERAVAQSLAVSRRGWIGSRVARDLTGGKLDERIPLVTHYAPGVIAPLAERVAKAIERKPVDAAVVPSPGGLSRTPSKPGLDVNTKTLRHALGLAASTPSQPADITAPTRRVAAKVKASDLADKYPAYIIINRGAHKLSFYRHLKLAQTYGIAVGRAGLETPAGLYDIQWKETNPSWHVPNSAWAGALAGTTVPPGPADPIKARWMAFNGGAGIHGTAEDSSIGTNASHGCVRMHVPDVIALYAVTPVGTPVYVI